MEADFKSLGTLTIYGHNQAGKSVLARLATRKMFVKPSQAKLLKGAPMQINHKEVSVTSKVHPTAGWKLYAERTVW